MQPDNRDAPMVRFSLRDTGGLKGIKSFAGDAIEALDLVQQGQDRRGAPIR